jgi:serine/threonine protein kinase
VFALTIGEGRKPPITTEPLAEGAAGKADLGPTADWRLPGTGLPPVLGGYRILRPLGQGGMCVVFLARQLSLDRKVALKMMKPKWAHDPQVLMRFTREAYAAAHLVHHNVVQIYDIGEDKGIPFFTMEFVSGVTLAQLVQEKGKLDVEEAVGYVLQAPRPEVRPRPGHGPPRRQAGEPDA